MHEAACIYDSEGRFGLVNEYLAEWYDTTPEALESDQSTLISRIREQADGDPYQELLAGERSEVHGELDDEFPNHGYAVLEYRLTPLSIDGTIEAVVGVARDIADRKERERSLERIRERIELALEYTNSVVFDIDFDTGRVLRHGTYEQFFDHQPDEVPTWQEHCEHAVHPDDRQAFRRFHQEFIDGTRTSGSIQYRTTPETGASRWIEAYVHLRNDAEPDKRALGISRDITGQKEREQELREFTSQYATLVEYFPDDGVFLFNEDAQYIRAGGSELSQVGLSSADFEGQTPYDLFPEEIAKETVQYYQATVQGESHIYQQRYQNKEYEIRTMSIRDDTGDAIYGMAVSHNISQQVEQKRELERQNERLEEFASFVSHDLRNPLRTAEGQIELAQIECDCPHLDDAADAIDRSQTLIDDLLTLARSGETVGSTTPVSVSDLAEECWGMIPDGDATLTIESTQTALVDRTRLGQLLENLLGNAVKHGGEGVTVRVGDVEDGFYIEDDGVGIPESERENIFQAGYSTAEEGTGLGLHIVKQVADAHGREVGVTDGIDGGTRFEITGVEFADG